ncbi:MAG: rod shape-determining protein RodA [Candidatus Omnitrophota bacterium]
MRDAGVRITVIALILCVLGIMSIYSNTHQKDDRYWQLTYQRQIFWVILGLVIFSIASHFNYRNLWDFSYFLYAFALFLLFLVFVLGVVRLGAQRWLKVAWFNFQPSELVKLMFVIFYARYFSAKSVHDVSLRVGKFGAFRAILLPLLFLSVPLYLIIEQPDLGSAVMIMMIFVVMLFLGHVKLRYLLAFIGLILVFLPLGWHFLRDYQKDRLIVFLNPNIDPLGAGYTIIQSKIAIGSGGFLGKGWLSGTQSQLYFLPESHTDFIFATFIEEWGLLGGGALLGLYYLLIRQGILIAAKTYDHFGRLLALGISAMLSLQVFINVAMNLGLAPVVGIPLPLMSYGGSSLFSTLLSLGILVNINKTRAVF